MIQPFMIHLIHKSVLINFIAEKALSTMTVAIGKIKANSMRQ